MAPVDVTEIINCPQCGTRNRVGAFSNSLRPVCGRCHASLVTVVVVERTQPPACKSSKAAHRLGINVLLGALLVLGMTAGFAVLIIPQKKATGSVGTEHPSLAAASVLPPQSAVTPEPPRPLLNRRLPNGTSLRNSMLGGLGQLTIKNGGSLDAVAKLVSLRDRSCRAFFYISAQSEFTLGRIDDGYYRLLFCIGEDWDSATRSFIRKKAFSEFEQSMVFETHQEAWGGSLYEKYSVLEITLHPVPNGNARTQYLSEQEFDKY